MYSYLAWNSKKKFWIIYTMFTGLSICGCRFRCSINKRSWICTYTVIHAYNTYIRTHARTQFDRMTFDYKTIEIWPTKRGERVCLCVWRKPNSIPEYACINTLIILISKPSPSLFKWIQIHVYVISHKTFVIHPCYMLFFSLCSINNFTNKRVPYTFLK